MKSGPHVIVAHDISSYKDYVLRGAAAMAFDLSKFGTISEKKYGEPLDGPVCVCGFEKAFSAEQLIDFRDPVRPLMDCIEQSYKRQLVHSRMVSLLFVTKFLTVLVSGQENPARAQLPCFPDEISKAELLLPCFESHV